MVNKSIAIGTAAVVIAFAFLWPLCASFLSELFFDADRVHCYPIEHGKASVTASFKDVVGQYESNLVAIAKMAEQRTLLSIKHRQSELAEALEKCREGSCTADDQRTLRVALRSYLDLRMRTTTRLLGPTSTSSDLDKVQNYFGTPEQGEIAAKLRSLVNARVLSLRSLGSRREAAALFILQPANAFLPCALKPSR